MGFFKWLKSKTVTEEIIFDGENLYEKIKTDSENDMQKMYEPLDKELIEQAIIEDRVNNTFDEKKTSVEHICEQMVICSQRIKNEKNIAIDSYVFHWVLPSMRRWASALPPPFPMPFV